MRIKFIKCSLAFRDFLAAHRALFRILKPLVEALAVVLVFAAQSFELHTCHVGLHTNGARFLRCPALNPHERLDPINLRLSKSFADLARLVLHVE